MNFIGFKGGVNDIWIDIIDYYKILENRSSSK